MAAASKKKTATKKAAGKKPAAKKAASDKPASKKATAAPVAKQATKVPKKKPAKKAAAKKPGLGKTVNMGPTRGNSSWPPSNQPMSQDRSRTDRTSTTANRDGGRKAGEAPKQKK